MKLLGSGDGSLIFGRSQKKSSMEKHQIQHDDLNEYSWSVYNLILWSHTNTPFQIFSNGSYSVLGLLIVSHCHDQCGMMLASSYMCKICHV